MRSALACTIYLLLVLWSAADLALLAHAAESAWRTGRITSIRVLERGEGSSATPPVEENGAFRPARPPGTIAYVALQSGKQIFHAQYAGAHLDALQQLRNRVVRFRAAGGKLYLQRSAAPPFELLLLPNNRLPADARIPRK